MFSRIPGRGPARGQAVILEVVPEGGHHHRVIRETLRLVLGVVEGRANPGEEAGGIHMLIVRSVARTGC